MHVKRHRKIGDLRSRLIKQLAKEKKEKEFDFGQLNPMNWEFLGGDRKFNPKGAWENVKDYWGRDGGKKGSLYDTEGEFEGKEIAEMNAILADPESSPPISKIGSLLSAEGESGLDQAGRDMMDRRKVDEEFAAMENPPEDSYGDKLSSYLGQAGDYVTGLFSPTASYSKIKEDTGESALDKIGRENMLNEMDDLGPDKTDIESSFWERTKQGRVGDAFSGLFSSDSGRDESLAKEKKDNEELSGKIGAAAKLYSLFKPETPQAAPTIPTASITRGSVAFPGMQLASQKQRRKYFTPKGLMA